MEGTDNEMSAYRFFVRSMEEPTEEDTPGIKVVRACKLLYKFALFNKEKLKTKKGRTPFFWDLSRT